ncbi:hypothetical protein HZB60_07970 [candidate division KSB1 bacterium]|nr:hypothetical protein [candidate division KSB1 bacterium]
MTRRFLFMWFGCLVLSVAAALADSLRTSLPPDSLPALADSSLSLADSLANPAGLREAWLYPLGVIILGVGAVVALFTLRSK